jgi:tetratricopeptide (TPR) repeat protein
MSLILQSVLLAWALSQQQVADVATYRQVIEAYRDGRVLHEDPVASGAGGLSIVSRVVESASGWTAADLAAAAMFHTDVALRLAKASRQEGAAAHAGAAAALLRAAVEREPTRTAFARRWRSTVSGLLHAAGALDLAKRIEAEALPGLAESKQQAGARAAFALGLTEEIRAAVAGPLSGSVEKRNVPVPPEARRALADAARHLQNALAADPTDAEAALHLGRIMIVAGREIDADRPLRVAAGAPDSPVRYLAMMFLGAIAERQSRYADAERHYLAALDTFPWGQSAPLALSHVLMREGREAEARAAVARHFTRTGARAVEPLWTYLADPATDLGPTLNLLRAEVWR